MKEYKFGVKNPILSIAMIFRDDMRCIERCLDALTPLRKAIPCELVMADTGSVDGSRKVAERYADQIIDFPWINDFAAARNAVLDQCHGLWHLSVDTDEYLDPDIEELVDFLSDPSNMERDFACVVNRNYTTDEMLDGEGMDFFALRIAKRDERFSGKIHEALAIHGGDENVVPLGKTIFHHDGYAGNRMNKKKKRNGKLVKEALEADPKNLRILGECLDAAISDEEVRKYCCRAMELLGNEDDAGEEWYSAALLRNVLNKSKERNYPELYDWISFAKEHYGDSPFTQIDVSRLAGECYLQSDPERALQEFSAYWEALGRYQRHEYSWTCLFSGVLDGTRISVQQAVHLVSAQCQSKLENWPAGLEELKQIDLCQCTILNHIDVYVSLVVDYWWRSQTDVRPVLLSAWKKLKEDTTSKLADARRKQFLAIGRRCLDMKLENQDVPTDARLTEDLFVQLGEDCPLGRSALLIKATTSKEAEQLLNGVEEWDFIASAAIHRAFELNAAFPDSFYAMPSEITEQQALNLVRTLEKDSAQTAQDWAKRIPQPSLGQTMWLYELTLITILGDHWDKQSAEALFSQFRHFGQRYLDCFYPSCMQSEENLHLLPATLRFVWYYIQAQKELDAGKTVEYIRLLRKGLKTAPMMKKVVEYLSKSVQDKLDAEKENEEELQALAQQVKMMLSAFPADHPSVIVLKQSPAYQKIAHLLEM